MELSDKTEVLNESPLLVMGGGFGHERCNLTQPSR